MRLVHGFADSNYAGIKLDHTFCKTGQNEKYFKKRKNLFLQTPALPIKEHFSI